MCNLNEANAFQAQNEQNQTRGSRVFHRCSFSIGLHILPLSSSWRLRHGHSVFEVSNERKLASPTRVGRPSRSFDTRSLSDAGCYFSLHRHFPRCILDPPNTLQCNESPGYLIGRQRSSRQSGCPSVSFQIHNITTPPLERRSGALLYS
ncbi:hypothetical protein D3C87_1713560 [compost metagenome]